MKRFFILLLLLFIPFFLSESQGIRIAVSPLIRDVSIDPGESKELEMEVFNNSDFDLEMAPMVLNFRDGGEGKVSFINPLEIEKSIDEGKEFLLSQWIEIDSAPFLVPSKGSATLDFKINIPEDAPPGGRYAAIAVGARPKGVPDLGNEDPKGALMISPSVSSILLVSVGGEVVEEIRLRRFSTERIHTTTEAIFSLELENKGNTHLRPWGSIDIYNSWGKKVGNLPINLGTDFGNILPGSSRSWDIVWRDENSFLDIGKHEAVLTILYGRESIQVLTASIEFWIFPLRRIAFLLLYLFLFVSFIIFVIKLIPFFIKTLPAKVKMVYNKRINQKK